MDLSSVKFNRLNLEGSESGLFREILRVLELLRQVFGRKFRIFFFVENVASMDKSAPWELSLTVYNVHKRFLFRARVIVGRTRSYLHFLESR